MFDPISPIKTLLDAFASFRTFLRERREKRQAEQDEDELPRVIAWMDETEQKIRKEQNLNAYVPVFDDAQWWLDNGLPGVSRRLIRRGIEERQKRQERIASLWRRGAR